MVEQKFLVCFLISPSVSSVFTQLVFHGFISASL